MRMAKALRANRDVPQLEASNIAAATAGTGTDYEHIFCVIPDLTKNAPSGEMGMVPSNAMSIRWVDLAFEAALTGANTNNFTLLVNQYRSGALLVNTSSATTVVASTMAVTPLSMANIHVGDSLVFSGGTGAAETVVVSAVTPTTFTATFANGHSGAYTITSAPIVTITYASGTNETKFGVRQLTPVQNTVQGGDVLTIQRLSIGTGLASPAFLVSADLVSSGPR